MCVRACVCAGRVELKRDWLSNSGVNSELIILPTVECCEITSLTHKIGNDSVKYAASVAVTKVANAQCSEILSSLWDLSGQCPSYGRIHCEGIFSL